MGQRASQPNGRSPTSQGRVRSANTRATRARTFAGLSPGAAPFFGEPCLKKPGASASTARATLAFTRLSACAPLLGQLGSAICCTVSRSNSAELTDDFASRFSAVVSQLRRRGDVSVMNALPAPRAARGPTFEARSLSPDCDRETNTKSQGDLSCRRIKRMRLPRSVRLPYENLSGDRTW